MLDQARKEKDAIAILKEVPKYIQPPNKTSYSRPVCILEMDTAIVPIWVFLVLSYVGGSSFQTTAKTIRQETSATFCIQAYILLMPHHSDFKKQSVGFFMLV